MRVMATGPPRRPSGRSTPTSPRFVRAGWPAGPVLGLLLALTASWYVVGIQPATVLDRRVFTALWQLLAAAVPPDLSMSFLGTALWGVVHTLAIAVISSVLAVAIGLPLAVLATPLFWHAASRRERRTQTTNVHLLLIAPLRSLLAVVRAVPDLLWALLFVAAAGLGPAAGVLALAVTYSAALGRMYADVFDGVAAGPVQSLRAHGFSRPQVFLWAIWPQAVPGLVAYTLYSFECTIRAASVLGFVGAGGIGQELALSLRLFRYDEALTLLCAFAILTVGGDQISRLIRQRLRGAEPTRTHAPTRVRRSRDPWPRAAPTIAGWAIFALVSASAFNVLLLGNGAFDGPGVGRRLLRFVASCFPPDVNPDFLLGIVRPLVETIAISMLGTAGGIVLASVLAIPATATLVLRSRDSAGREALVSRLARASVYGSARFVLGVLRAVPDVVWVMICVIIVGFGPAAGTLAIMLHTGGVLGRLYAETLEEAAEGPIRAVRTAGARAWQILIWSAYPAVKPLMASYTMLRWESNLRVCTILGLVGGGGLGEAIYQNVQLGFYPRVLTLVTVVALLVVTTDRLSERLRVRLQQT